VTPHCSVRAAGPAVGSGAIAARLVNEYLPVVGCNPAQQRMALTGLCATALVWS